jgi:hypothetical protein
MFNRCVKTLPFFGNFSKKAELARCPFKLTLEPSLVKTRFTHRRGYYCFRRILQYLSRHAQKRDCQTQPHESIQMNSDS